LSSSNYDNWYNKTEGIVIREFPEATSSDWRPPPTQVIINKRRHKGRRYVFSKKYNKKILLDEFNEPFFGQEEDDKTIPVPISLPLSLVEELDIRLDMIKNEPDPKLRNEGITRSRFIRHLIEKELNLEYGGI